MNRTNVKGRRRVYQNVTNDTKEGACKKSSSYITSEKYLSCDDFSCSGFVRNRVYSGNTNNENVDLYEKCSALKTDGKEFSGSFLPSARDSESHDVFGTRYSSVSRRHEKTAGIKEQIKGGYPRWGGFSTEGSTADQNILKKDGRGSSEEILSDGNSKSYDRFHGYVSQQGEENARVKKQKDSNKTSKEKIPSFGNSGCVSIFQNGVPSVKHTKRVSNSKSPVNINESYDYYSNACSGTSICFSTNDFNSDAIEPNKHQLSSAIYFSSENRDKAKASGLRNCNINFYRNRGPCDKSTAHYVDPHAIVFHCMSEINHMSDMCLTNHGNELGKICLKGTAVEDSKDILNTLSNYKTNMLAQQKCYSDFTTHLRNEVIGLFSNYNINNSDDIIAKTRDIVSKMKDECKLFSYMYPAYALRQVLQTSIVNYQVTVITCDVTYCSNIVIPLLLRNTFNSGMIASCEVNEAVSLFSAQNCCYLLDQKLGQLVGYDIEQEILASKNTKIVYTTVKTLISYSLNDPYFSKYSCIVVNDFLYQSIEADILLATLAECLNQRDDLRLVILASTKHKAENLKCFFSRKHCDNVSVISTKHVNFPVQVIWKQSFCKPDDDITLEAVNICFSIHVMKPNDRGSVLVFLPTEEDARKVTELTMQKFCEYSFTDVYCTYISEKSKTKKMRQIREQQQQSKRSVIFTNSGFEVVLFPNVHYVVDFGRTIEVTYDTKKKIEIQKMSFISRQRSKIRKMCFGMCTSGICFRMYSKKNYKKTMVYDETPEVLSRSPLNSLIKIFKFRLDSALALEFVESFSEEIKENAVSTLQSLGVLENGKLTNLGEFFVKLPFPPEYSKLLILGKQLGLLFEVIILVSFFSSNLDDVFKSKSMENIKKIDAAKLHFLQNDSDTLTFLNIYRQWVEHKYSESWCADNYIEFNFLGCVQSKIKEVCETVKDILGVTVLEQFSDDYQITPVLCSSLQKILFECFRDNLCVYSGHITSGYKCLTAHCSVFLHPSTFIAEKRNPPQYIVYNKFISETRNFITHITVIPDSYVIYAIDQGLLKFRHDAWFDQKLVPHIINPVGLSVIKHALTKDNVRDLEEHIKKETESEFIIIEPSEEKGIVTLYCLPNKWCKAEEIMRKFLDENMEKFWDEEETQVLELQKGDSKVSVNIVWSKGAEISSVVVDAHHDTKLDFQSDSSCSSIISLSRGNVTHNSHRCIVLTWLRRPCVGEGYVEFNSFKDFSKARKLAMKSVAVKGTSVQVEVMKHEKFRLAVHELDPETVDEDLRIAFQEKLPGVSISDAKVKQLPSHQTNSDEIKAIEESFINQCRCIFGTDVLAFKVHKPKNDEVIMTAEAQPSGALNTYNLENLVSFLNGIGILKVNETTVKAKALYYTFLFCSTDIWDKIQPCIDQAYNEFIQKLENNVSCEIEVKVLDSQTHRLKIVSENEESMAELRKVVQNLLEGSVITSDDNNCLPVLFCHGGQLFLCALKSRVAVCIIEDYKTKTLRIYGSEQNCKVAKHDIIEYLSRVEEETVYIMSLDHGKNSRILLRNIIQTYDVELKELIEKCKLRSAELNIQKCELTLHGTVDSIEQAITLLEKLEESESDCNQDTLSDQEKCPICLGDVLTHAIRLESCGHFYCRLCSRAMFTKSQFPIRCSIEECSKIIILEDIRRLLDYNMEKIKDLLRKSLKQFISCNKFVYCPVPDCPMFMDQQHITDDKWNCPLCHNDICNNCKTIYHDGYTCDVYQGMKTDSDYGLKAYMNVNPNCKKCPKCGVLIEKNAGCNHMHCHNPGCNADFCWRCRKLFDSEMEVLIHQRNCEPEE